MGILLSSGDTKTGRNRSLNCDAISICPDIGCFLLADGFGNPEKGRMISQTAVTEIEKRMRKAPSVFNLQFNDIICEVNDYIINTVNQPNNDGQSGTTLTALFVDGNQYSIAHVGDSRCYWISEDNITCLTKDHTLVQQWIDEGVISEEQAKFHERRHILRKAFGIESPLKFDFNVYPLEKDGLFFLCSDGLYDLYEDNEIRSIILDHVDDLDLCIQTLIDTAVGKGSQDDISAILIQASEMKNG